MSVQTISTLKTLSEISRYVTYLTVFGFIVKIGALFSILLISINSNNYIARAVNQATKCNLHGCQI